MARQRSPSAAREPREPIGQALADLLDAKHPRPHGGELDRQRQTVEAAAEVDDGRLVRRRQLERARCRSRTLHNEHDRRVLARLRERLGRTGKRQLERRHGQHALARHR